MASLVERQIGPGPVPVWDIQTASAGQIDACCGLGRGVNLLDNAYFIGGGSQQGGEQFPINQRGKTSWTGANNRQYSFDRWWVYEGTVTITALGITASNGLIAQNFSEYMAQYLNGKVITLSVFGLIGNSPKCVSYTLTYNMSGNIGQDTEFGDITVAGSNSGYGYYVQVRYIPTGVTIQAIQLELGPVQTIAHKEGDTWVLNAPPPNYGMELIKCQRYLQRIDTFSPLYAIWNSGKEASVFITFDEMRANPTFLSLGGIELRNSGGSTITDAIFAQAQNSPRTIQIRVSTTTTSMDKGYYITGTGLLTADL